MANLNEESKIHPFFLQGQGVEPTAVDDKDETSQQDTTMPTKTDTVHPFFSQEQSDDIIVKDETKKSKELEDEILNAPVDFLGNSIEEEDAFETKENQGYVGAVTSDVGKFVSSGDIVYRPVEGAAKAVGEVAQTFDEFGSYLQDVTGVGGFQIGFDPEQNDKFVFRYLNAKEWRDQDIKDTIIGAVENAAEATQEAIPDAATVTGALVEGVSQFATGFVLARKATGFGGITGTMANAAIADATAFDPYEQNISAMLQENAWMRNSFTEALATDEDDSAFKNRLRNAGEGFIVGGTLELAGAMYKAARATRKAKDEFITAGSVSDSSAKEFDTAVDELESMEAKLKQEAEDFKAGKIDKLSSEPSQEVFNKARETYKKKYDIKAARANSAIEAAEQKELSFNVASQNQDLARALIEQFEGKLFTDEMKNFKISREKNGKIEIDPELARAASKEKTTKLTSVKSKGLEDYVFGKSEVDVDEAINLATSENEMFSAMLKPEKFDAIVSIAAKYRDQFGSEWDKAGDTVIDKLFNLTVNKELIGGDELITDLNKYGLSFEDYIMTVVSSASEAGRTLQKLSQIKRQRPLNSKEELKMKELMEQQDTIRKTFMRVENIRRGMMVSQIATASRNLQSTLIRAPLETLGNVMDDSLVAFTEGGFGGFARTFSSRETWRRSFNHMNLIFKNPVAAKQYSELFFEQPELLDRADSFYNQLADMQVRMGRGEAKTNAGKVVDSVLSLGEDASALLNTPNRWQEYMTRNAMFLGTLERLVKREWDIDLIEAVNDGKIRDIMNDAGTVRPEGARSFVDIADEAIYDAMDLTYAAKPQLKVFNDLNNLIVRNGLTVAIPFPRFMFKSMELLGKYGAGASIPVTKMVIRAAQLKAGKKVTEIVDGKEVDRLMTGSDVRSFSRGERDAIGKNMQGLALLGAGIWYRSLEDSPEDYYMMNADEGFTFDTSAIFPLRPALLLGEMIKQHKQGTFERFMERNPKEILEVFTGQNFRAGPTGFILDDMMNSVFGTSEVSADTFRQGGGALGNYVGTFLVPYGQLIDSARAGGLANNEYKDQAPEPSLDKAEVLLDNFERPIKSRYYTANDKPNREMVLQEDMERKRMGAKVLAGINFKAADPEYASFLKRQGYTEFYLGSNSKSPSQRRSENAYIRQALKSITPVLQELEGNFREEWSGMSQAEKGGITFEQAFDSRYLSGKSGFESQLRRIKTNLRKKTDAELDTEVKTYIDFNKLPRAVKRRAKVEWTLQNDGRVPDMSDIETVQEITRYGSFKR